MRYCYLQDSHFTPQRRDCQRHFLNMVKLLKVHKQVNNIDWSLLVYIVWVSTFILTLFYFPAKIVTDKVSERSKGFGFVTYASEDEAEKALQEMNGKVQIHIISVSVVDVYYYVHYRSSLYDEWCSLSMDALSLWTTRSLKLMGAVCQ